MCIFSPYSSCEFEVPELNCPFIAVPKSEELESSDRMSHLAWFFFNTLLLAVKTLYQLGAQVHPSREHI